MSCDCAKRYVVPLAVTTDPFGAGSATLPPSAWPTGAVDVVAFGERTSSMATGIPVWTIQGAATRLYGPAPLIQGAWTEHQADARQLVEARCDFVASVTGGPISSTVYVLFVFTLEA